MCSACAGDYEDPEMTAAEAEDSATETQRHRVRKCRVDGGERRGGGRRR